jgi:alpha-mannosidase
MQRPDASHIRQIHVVSNTHWDREFRRSLERTRRMLLEMLDVTLDILDRDPAYHSFTCDGHCILVEDYLEMRPERRPLVERLAREGRLLLGPWFTLPEVLSIGDEALVRIFIWAQKACRRLGTRPMPVGYTPASWGQTGQLPQIMASFGVDTPMFLPRHQPPRSAGGILVGSARRHTAAGVAFRPLCAIQLVLPRASRRDDGQGV